MSIQPPTGPAPATTSADVAAWLRARTQDSEGREVGLFTEDTRPSVNQVDVAIRQARTIVAGRMGWTVADACSYLYETAVALQAACIIEKSYFPEQVTSGRSPYEQLTEELATTMDTLEACIVNGGLGPAPAGGGDAFSILTPADNGNVECWAPANWNPAGAGAVEWLEARQAQWRGYPVVLNTATGRYELQIPPG